MFCTEWIWRHNLQNLWDTAIAIFRGKVQLSKLHWTQSESPSTEGINKLWSTTWRQKELYSYMQGHQWITKAWCCIFFIGNLESEEYVYMAWFIWSSWKDIYSIAAESILVVDTDLWGGGIFGINWENAPGNVLRWWKFSIFGSCHGNTGIQVC